LLLKYDDAVDDAVAMLSNFTTIKFHP
jgi:hypothetical protein